MRIITTPFFAALLFTGSMLPADEPAPLPRPAPRFDRAASQGGTTVDTDKTIGRVTELIEQLGHPEFAQREAAERELNAAGEQAWWFLRRALASHPSPEVRARTRRLVGAIARREFVEIRQFKGPQHGYWINRVLFTPDSKWVICAGGGVITYDLETGREVRRTMELQYARRGLVLTRDGRHFLTGHQRDPVMRLGELSSGKEIRTFEGHIGGVRGVALAPDESRTASAGDDGTVRLWNAKSGKELRRFVAPGGLTAWPSPRMVGTWFRVITSQAAATWSTFGI